jgi:hypothetical protein
MPQGRVRVNDGKLNSSPWLPMMRIWQCTDYLHLRLLHSLQTIVTADPQHVHYMPLHFQTPG